MANMKQDEFRLHGKTLQLLRIIFNLTQTQIAESLGVKIPQISQSEKSKRKLTRLQTLRVLEMVQLSESVAIDFDNNVNQLSNTVQVDELLSKSTFKSVGGGEIG